MTDITTNVNPPSGYVSDAELLTWLEAKSTDQYDDLREEMKISTERQDLIKDLKNLQSEIDGISSPEDIAKILDEMRSLLSDARYEPYVADLQGLLSGTIASLDQNAQLREDDDDDGSSSSTDRTLLQMLKDPITNETDKLGKVDGLALVRIQQLMSDAKETSQLASNVLSSRDQTASSIIGNIRG